MGAEAILFNKGLAYDSRSALKTPGFLQTATNIQAEVDGQEEKRHVFTNINTTAVGSIHSCYRFRDIAIIGDGTHLRFRSILTDGDFTDAYSTFTNAPWRFREFKDFCMATNGTDQVLIDANGNIFPAQIYIPASSPSGAAGAAGNPSGHYYLYTSYVITFPNGMRIETGLCNGSADVSVSSQAISWTAIPTATYAAFYAGASDAFNKCQVLIHFYNQDGATSAIESAKARTITFAGDAQIDTAWSALGGSSLLVAGTGYVSLAHSADFNLSTTPFTMEFFARFSAVAANQGFAGKYQDANNYWYLLWTQATTTLQFKAVSGGVTVADYTATWAPAINTKYHISVDRNGTSFYIFVNGTALTLTAATAIASNSMPAMTSGALEIGAANNHATFMTGWIDEFSLYSNLAKRTAAFTTPTVQSEAPAIHRNLYRGPGSGGTLTDIYYVATLYDNTTTTYTDDASDLTLAANGASLVDDYEPLPNSHFIEFHYGRAFTIHDLWPDRLCYSEVATDTDADIIERIMPVQSTDYNWDDIRVSAFGRAEPMGIIAWGPYLYIAFKQTWIRKYGEDPDTWNYKKTWAQHGVGAEMTVDLCPKPQGIAFLATPDGGECGIALYNGQQTQVITTPLLDYIFNTDLDKTKIAYCRGFCGGNYYHFFYPSTAATGNDPDKWLAIDLRRFPEIRAFYWSFTAGYPVSGFSYSQGNTYYIGTSDGYLKRMDTSSSETMSVSVRTAERVGGEVKVANMTKTLKRLKYNLDSGGADIALTIYINGTAATWPDGTTTKTIKGTGDAVQVLPDIPQNFSGYRYSIGLAGTGLSTFKLYDPWEVEFDITQ